MTNNTSSVSPKGQVTIPREIREEFGIAPRDHVSFDVVDGDIRIIPVKQRLLKHHMRYPSQLGKLDWTEVEAIAHEEATENVLAEGNSSLRNRR